jgi:hypothetical protein
LTGYCDDDKLDFDGSFIFLRRRAMRSVVALVLMSVTGVSASASDLLKDSCSETGDGPGSSES